MQNRSIISAAVAVAVLGLAPFAFAETSGAEQAACACATPFNNPNESPFAHREYIAGVQPYKVTTSNGKRSVTELEGATIKLRAAPGLTSEWLQQLINEHLAHMSTMGAGDMAWCPLALKDVSATVTSTGDGFAVTVQSTDREVAKEVLRRAEALVSAR